jgi:nitrogen fixation/metabolism regulation signal transduction histidine kinase
MPHKRSSRSYLLDPRFQLKWTAYLVVIVFVLLAGLGYVIAQTAGRASDTAQLAVKEAERAYEESRSNSILVRQMIAVAAPDNAALAGVIDDSLAEPDQKAEKDLAAVKKRHDDIARDRRNIQLTLVAAGAALLLLLAVMGIVITHRIVGPVHKMKRLLRRVSTGRLVVDDRLRRGDELEDLFETFLQMTYSLRAMQNARIATLDGTLRRAEATGASEEVLEGLRALRATMTLGLEKRRTSVRPPPPVGA